MGRRGGVWDGPGVEWCVTHEARSLPGTNEASASSQESGSVSSSSRFSFESVFYSAFGEISHPAPLEITITTHFFCPSKSPLFYGLCTDVFSIGVVTCG